MPPRERKSAYAVDFGAFVRRLRMARHWTIAELARQINHSASWLSVLEKGGNMPSIVTLIQLGRAVSMRPSELLRKFEDEREALASAHNVRSDPQ